MLRVLLGCVRVYGTGLSVNERSWDDALKQPGKLLLYMQGENQVGWQVT